MSSKLFFEAGASSGSSSSGRAACYIFSNEEYPGLPNNPTNELDIRNLKDSLSRLSIVPVIQREKTADEIRQIMVDLKQTDFSTFSAIMTIIISNGVDKGRVHAKDELYDLEAEIFRPLINNLTLVDKPKIFIIEANRGSMEFDDVASDALAFGRKPSNIIKLFSNYEGYKTYRSQQGSLLIQSFCTKLNEYGSAYDVKDIFERVQKDVITLSNERAFPVIETNLTSSYVLGQS